MRQRLFRFLKRVPRFIPWVALACSERELTVAEPGPNPQPVLISIAPSVLSVGSGPTPVTLTGSGFVKTSRVLWNDSDRHSQFRDAQTLVVTLLDTDVIAVSQGRIRVVNDAPGGGSSDELQVAVEFALPTIMDISPATIAIPAPTAEFLPLTITGSGFVRQSTVRIGAAAYFVTPLSYNTIQLGLSYAQRTNPATYPVSVVNPTPGGGTSNTVEVNVVYPVPTISALSPDSSLAGNFFYLSVFGAGFGVSSFVRWNGVDYPATLVSPGRLSASIPGAAATAPQAIVAVHNPLPGGGTSSPVVFPVRDRTPIVNGISPGVVTAGAGSTIVTLTGVMFRQGTTARWNGTVRPSSLVNPFSMTMMLTAADLELPSIGKITVRDSLTGAVTNPVFLAVVAPLASMSVTRTIDVTHADLVYDNTRDVLYASVPSSATQNPDRIVRIDPVTGAITGSVIVGSNPGVLAITEDDQYLYVGLRGVPVIARIALTTFTLDLQIPIPQQGIRTVYAGDLQPLPGSPRAIAVSTVYVGLSASFAGIVLFDDAVPRPVQGFVNMGSHRITRGPTSNRIYGFNDESTEYGFRSLLVVQDGVFEDVMVQNLLRGRVDIEYSGGFIYGTSGDVIDPVTMKKVGTIPNVGIVRPDAPNARVHFLEDSTIRSYHYTSYTMVGSYTNPAFAGHTKLIRWSRDGLAIGGGASIVLVKGSQIAN